MVELIFGYLVALGKWIVRTADRHWLISAVVAVLLVWGIRTLTAEPVEKWRIFRPGAGQPFGVVELLTPTQAEELQAKYGKGRVYRERS